MGYIGTLFKVHSSSRTLQCSEEHSLHSTLRDELDWEVSGENGDVSFKYETLNIKYECWGFEVFIKDLLSMTFVVD